MIENAQRILLEYIQAFGLDPNDGLHTGAQITPAYREDSWSGNSFFFHLESPAASGQDRSMYIEYHPPIANVRIGWSEAWPNDDTPPPVPAKLIELVTALRGAV